MNRAGHRSSLGRYKRGSSIRGESSILLVLIMSGALLAALKLTNAVDFSWAWVALPLAIPAAIILFNVVMILVVIVVKTFFSGKAEGDGAAEPDKKTP